MWTPALYCVCSSHHAVRGEHPAVSRVVPELCHPQPQKLRQPQASGTIPVSSIQTHTTIVSNHKHTTLSIYVVCLFNLGIENEDMCYLMSCVASVFSFLLGKHKAAIEVYNEAARLNQKDWVSTLLLSWVLSDECVIKGLVHSNMNKLELFTHSYVPICANVFTQLFYIKWQYIYKCFFNVIFYIFI